MPTPLVGLLIAALGILAAVAITYWHRILQWAYDSLFPWFHTHLPFMEEAVRTAFEQADKVAVPVRRAVKEAWKKVRDYLIKLVVNFQRRNASVWVKEVTSWVIRGLETDRPMPVKLTTTEDVSWEDVPEDIRAEFLQREKRSATIDVTEIRDQELEMEI